MPLFPAEAGNRARVVEFIDLLEAAGARVLVFYADITPGSIRETRRRLGNRLFVARFRSRDPRYVLRRLARVGLSLARRWAPELTARLLSRREEAGRATPLDGFFDPHVFSVLQRIVSRWQPDSILFVYAIWAPYAERLQSAGRLLLDSQDRLGDRHVRVPGARGGFSLSVQDEVRALRAFHEVIAIQDVEAEYFRELADVRVTSIGHLTAPSPVDLVNLAGSRCVGFIGGNNPANRAALQTILTELWPRIRAEVPDASLLIAGKVDVDLSSHPGVRRLGFVKHTRDFYPALRLLLNPVPWGTGLKIKVVEALAFGVPVVTTSHGCEGLPSSGAGVIVSDALEQMAASCAELLQNPSILRDHHEDAVAFYAKWHSNQLLLFAEVFGLNAAK